MPFAPLQSTRSHPCYKSVRSPLLQLLRRQLELHEDAKTMLATRTHFFQKLIGKLNQKVGPNRASNLSSGPSAAQIACRVPDRLVVAFVALCGCLSCRCAAEGEGRTPGRRQRWCRRGRRRKGRGGPFRYCLVVSADRRRHQLVPVHEARHPDGSGLGTNHPPNPSQSRVAKLLRPHAIPGFAGLPFD